MPQWGSQSLQPAAMSTNQRSTSATGHRGGEKTYFEQQREALIGEIAMVWDNTQANCWRMLTVCIELRACPREYQQAEPVTRGRHYRASKLSRSHHMSSLKLTDQCNRSATSFPLSKRYGPNSRTSWPRNPSTLPSRRQNAKALLQNSR